MKRIIFLLFLSASILSSCVSRNKEELEAARDSLEDMSEAIKDLRRDTSGLGRAYRLQMQMSEQQKESYQTLFTNHERLMENLGAQTGINKEMLAQTEKELQELSAENQLLIADNEKLNQRLLDQYNKITSLKKKASIPL